MDMTGAIALRCAACDSPLLEGDRFCEQCGARLTPEAPDPSACRVCGARPLVTDPDGYCSVCGARERAGADRVEVDLATAAAVSDRGRVHRRNEDAFSVQVAGSSGLAVVCDGISSASAGDTAARRAADAAAAALGRALAEHAERRPDATEVIRQAAEAAGAAVAAVPWTTRTDRDQPSCTLVCAVWRDGEISVGWLGDSRAYWIDKQDAQQLTLDDSWAQEQVSEGRLSLEQALNDPRAHAITRWVGGDTPARAPGLTGLHAQRAGRLVLCSDGLWNYAITPAQLRELIDALPPGASPAAVARSLADTALARGGRDNITVVVVDIDPS
jgi:serine/threonine protein phosphatase PrpC